MYFYPLAKHPQASAAHSYRKCIPESQETFLRLQSTLSPLAFLRNVMFGRTSKETSVKSMTLIASPHAARPMTYLETGSRGLSDLQSGFREGLKERSLIVLSTGKDSSGRWDALFGELIGAGDRGVNAFRSQESQRKGGLL